MTWLLDNPVIPAVVGLAALALFVVGRRGWRINDHPICARCRFDLVGRPPGGEVCPECGADLLRPGALRDGARQPARGALAIALFLLIPSAALLAFQAWSATTEVPWVQRKPLAWVLNDAGSRDAVTRDEAFNELFVRLRAGALSRAQIRQVVDRALAHQANSGNAWLPRWGDFVEEACRGGHLTADAWRQYARQAPQFDWVATGRFARGERAWLELIERPTRVGALGEFALRVHRRLTIVDSRGGRVERDFGQVSYRVGGRSGLRGGWSLPLNDGMIGRLADGRQEATLDLVVEIYPAGPAPRGPTAHPPLATEKLSLRTAWVVDPRPLIEPGVALNAR